MNKKVSILLRILIFLIFFTIGILLILIKNNNDDNDIESNKNNKTNENIDYSINYNTYVKTIVDANLYDNNKKIIGKVSVDTNITLDDNYSIIDGYYKLKNLDYFISYLDVKKTDEEVFDNNEYKTFRNYIVYNESITTNNNYKLYLSDNTYYEINGSDVYPIIIKEDDKYGVEFNDHLVYINKNDVKNVYENNNTDLGHADDIAVLNYHFTIDETTEEGSECRQTICMSSTQVEEEIKYLSDNQFYSATMQDLYLFLTGKIQLPEKSVVITIDDGWYVARMIAILEKYHMMGTLYLIGSLANPSDYASEYLEIHSHSWDLHTPNVCNGLYGGGLLCLDEQVILDDLKKSRESLNNTEFFCYPFYEYNDRAVKLLQKAGFKMAFGEGQRKAKPGDNMFVVPRYALTKYTNINTFISYVN